ncbi:hypothetical protein FRC01_012836 [Tulasnella sp. 417]|nr:hypothetical protein FRC01_012836 [Tulasnella sp. 417]
MVQVVTLHTELRTRSPTFVRTAVERLLPTDSRGWDYQQPLSDSDPVDISATDELRLLKVQAHDVARVCKLVRRPFVGRNQRLTKIAVLVQGSVLVQLAD